jgi:hypothetical protein
MELKTKSAYMMAVTLGGGSAALAGGRHWL